MMLINNIRNNVLIVLIMITFNYQAMSQSNYPANEFEDTQTTRKSWNFIAYLDDEKIGYHNFEIINKAGEMIVNIQAKFDVSFMFIPVYSYEHKNKEVWSNDCLISLDSSTLDGGEKLFVNLSNNKGITHIVTPDNNIKKNSCIRSFAYWDYELINSKALLNVQTGELIDVNYDFIGIENITINNQPISARHYQLNGKDSDGKLININLWYNSDNKWLALESRLDNGRSLRYQLAQESVQ